VSPRAGKSSTYAVNQKVAKATPERMGHRVTLAGNSNEAVEKWRAGSYDAIFMDVHMPELGCLLTQRAIRAAGARVPIIAMTAHSMDGDRERCRASGRDDYLSKRITSDALLEVLSRLPSLQAH